jgi:hypothetical protein
MSVVSAQSAAIALPDIEQRLSTPYSSCIRLIWSSDRGSSSERRCAAHPVLRKSKLTLFPIHMRLEGRKHPNPAPYAPLLPTSNPAVTAISLQLLNQILTNIQEQLNPRTF